MTLTMDATDKEKIKAIYKRLSTIGTKESSFPAVESMFYDAINISRSYGNDINTNEFLASLKKLEATEYKNTQTVFRKASQRESAIRRFMQSLRQSLHQWTA
jgi:hypothetical protein